MELIFIALILGFLTLFVLGLICLINPRWLGFQSRKMSSLIYFGGGLGCIVLVSLLDLQADTDEIPARTSNVENIQISYDSIVDVMVGFPSMTDAQRNRWREQNEWKYWVEGDCQVSEVSMTTWMSEISEASFEVACELNNGDRAVLFYGSEFEEQVLGLIRGDRLAFNGRLKTLRYWGFWTSGYVMVQ